MKPGRAAWHIIIKRHYNYKQLEGLKDIACNVLIRSTAPCWRAPWFLFEDLNLPCTYDLLLRPVAETHPINHIIPYQHHSETFDFSFTDHRHHKENVHILVERIFDLLRGGREAIRNIKRKTLGFMSNLLCASIVNSEIKWESIILSEDLSSPSECINRLLSINLVEAVVLLNNLGGRPDIIALTHDERRPFYFVEVKSRRERHSTVTLTGKQRARLSRCADITLLGVIDYLTDGISFTMKAVKMSHVLLNLVNKALRSACMTSS